MDAWEPRGEGLLRLELAGRSRWDAVVDVELPVFKGLVEGFDTASPTGSRNMGAEGKPTSRPAWDPPSWG